MRNAIEGADRNAKYRSIIKMAHRFVKFLLCASIALLITALWRQDVLPDRSRLRPELSKEPEQLATQQPPIIANVEGIDYTIQPLYKYELYGLVVSKHDSLTWWDSIHKEWNDHLNVADLCVVWGSNIQSDVYQKISFSSGQFVCNFSTSSDEAYKAFDQSAVSNNHLITDDKSITAALRNVRVGDQIHLRGFLAEYSHNHGFPFKRGTSIVRTDTGNGACETVYLKDFDILYRGGGPWHRLVFVAIFLLIGSCIAWFMLPVRREL